MKFQPGRPDPAPPLLRRLTYGALCWVNRHPMLLRMLGAVVRRWPVWGGAHVVARRSAVVHVLQRPESFSNTSHAANLVAGDFLIGMEPGQRYAADKALFRSVLATISTHADAAADKEARARIVQLRSSGRLTPFDLVEQYLMWVVLRALEPGFGAAAQMILAGSRRFVPDEQRELQYMYEVRHVAANLFAGANAPVEVQRRAEMAAASLCARIRRTMPEISMSWLRGIQQPYRALQRDAVGLAWVSHPVTVQAGALVVQELLGRPEEYRGLLEQAGQLGADVWTNVAFRNRVRNHVLELMRFRPVFPVLARDVPRATLLESGAYRKPVCPAGSTVGVLLISALFDSHATPDAGHYRPRRNWGGEEAARYLMFGYGERQCPAMDEALKILTSALIGLLTLPELRLAGPWGRPVHYDGPMVRHMHLRPV